MPPRVVLITGTSTGFGADYVVATARDPSSLKFKGGNDTNLLTARLDVTDRDSISRAFEEAERKFGRVDVVVDNAGYGLAGCFEEYDEVRVSRQMEVNFFGLVSAFFSFGVGSSGGGGGGDAGRGMDCLGSGSGGRADGLLCTVGCHESGFGADARAESAWRCDSAGYVDWWAERWAVKGFTEALSHELKPEWNIHLNLVEPGGFRTDWAGRSMTFADRKLPEYDHLDVKERMTKRHGMQRGEPLKAAVAMYKIACMGKDTPLRVAVGNDCYDGVMNKLKEYGQNYPKYEELSQSTDVDGYED